MERQAPKMTIRIRVATIEDAGPLAHISEKTFRASYAKFNAPEDMNAYCAETFGKAQQTSEILHPAKTTLLLENKGCFERVCANLLAQSPKLRASSFVTQRGTPLLPRAKPSWHGCRANADELRL